MHFGWFLNFWDFGNTVIKWKISLLTLNDVIM
jgi:hypothetical protein